jgi:hypothetical protein
MCDYHPFCGYRNREMRIPPLPVLRLSGARSPFPTSLLPNSLYTPTELVFASRLNAASAGKLRVIPPLPVWNL